MTNKSYVERTLETVVDFQALHRDQLTQMTQTFDESLGKIATSIDSLTIQVVQFNAGMKELRDLSKQILQAISQQTDAINGHLRVAEQQASTVTELTKLVAMQAATANVLIERMSQ